MSDLFTIYPAIDLRQGKVVRLRQGDVAAQTTYGDDPVATARGFIEQGAQWLHVVNLDGAFGESTRNLEVARAICTLGLPVQFGGGLRTSADVDTAFKVGVSRAILGTVAVRNPGLVRTLAAAHGAKVAVGIDARDSKVAVEGWAKTSEIAALELAQRMVEAGVKRFIYTDIARDGMLVGPDVTGAKALARTGAKVIASGGVGSLDHVRATIEPGIEGVVIGKALYEKRFTLRECLEAAEGPRA